MPEPEVLKITEYLNFTKISDTGKTIIVGIGNNSGVKLGLIKWMGAWRRYCFFPYEETLYDTKCLAEIIQFIADLMAQRKKS